MCWAALRDDNVSRHTTDCNAVWIQKLTIMLAACTKVKLEDSVTIKHLNTNQAMNQPFSHLRQQLVRTNVAEEHQNDKKYKSNEKHSHSVL